MYVLNSVYFHIALHQPGVQIPLKNFGCPFVLLFGLSAGIILGKNVISLLNRISNSTIDELYFARFVFSNGSAEMIKFKKSQGKKQSKQLKPLYSTSNIIVE